MCLSPNGKSVCFQELLHIYNDLFPEKCSYSYLFTSWKSLSAWACPSRLHKNED